MEFTKINRRLFFEKSAILAAPLIIQGQPIFANEGLISPYMRQLAETAVNNGNVLVIIQMNGGNDGLNMVISKDNYAQIAAARPTIKIPEASILPLDGNTATGLHPSMTGLQALYNAGDLKIVQGVSYPNPNFSHFRAQDILFTASNSNTTLSTGWVGRSLDIAFPGFPEGFPNAQFLDPPAIQIGGVLPVSLQGTAINMGYSVPSNVALQNVVNAQPATNFTSDYSLELDFLRIMKDQSNAYAGRIKTAYNGQLNLSTLYPATGNTLADQLKTVARLIGGGLATPIYIVNHPDSFDTHFNQVNSTNTTIGSHADILSKLSVAITAFQNDLALMGKKDKVIGMTFSEFGRRVINNTSFGTDHGSAMPVLVFGSKVASGVLGVSPQFTGTITSTTQVPMQFDFRQVYSTILEEWLGFSQPQADTTVLGATFNNLALFESTAPLPISGFNILATWALGKVKISFDVFDNDSFNSYEIQRTTDLKSNSFKLIGILESNSDNSRASYEYFDEPIRAKDLYYKVVAISKSAKRVSSKIVYLEQGLAAQKVSVYPNPIENQTINLDFYQNINETVIIELLNTNGMSMHTDRIKLNNEAKVTFKVQDMFETDQIYLLKITHGLNQTTEKVLFR
jgi:uncharacterized protein (DUF1501 family)